MSLLTAQLEALGLKRADASVLPLSGCHHFTLRRHDRQQLAGLHRRLQQIHHRVVQDLLRVLVAHLVGHVGQLVRGAHLRELHLQVGPQSQLLCDGCGEDQI